jgi:5-formyltetrahydrofolate cyclo-ligase
MNNKALKSEIRSSIRQQRNKISQSDSIRAGASLAAKLKASNQINNHQNIACFISFDGEISTQSTLSLVEQSGAHCFLPKLKPYKPNRLWFMPYRSNQATTNNKFGIPEVDLSVDNALPVSKLDAVLLPLVAFDLQGNRLGMGGGFYDATFSHLRTSKSRPKFIGLAYELQKIESLPSDSWDLPLDGVCTESNFYQFAP